MNTLLSRIKRGSIDLPPRTMLSGPQGIGKSTWASKAPSPLFIATEEGLTGLSHIERFEPETSEELTSFLNELLAAPSTSHRNLVFDTIDWLERMIHNHICKRDDYRDIEAYGGGWGKGDKITSYELVSLLALLEAIRRKHKIGIIFLSHIQIKAFNPPGGDPYDRYQPKGGKQFTGVLAEWVDASLFAVYEVFNTEVKGADKKKIKRTIAGDRVVHTQWSPAWDAKNRMGLPETLPLEWDDYEKAIKENSVPVLIEKVKAAHKAATKIPAADKPKWEEAMKKLDSMTADRLKVAIEKLETLK